MNFSETWLLKIFKDPMIKNPCPVQTLLYSAKAVGLTKQELKKARRRLGILSISINGVQHWLYIQGSEDNA